jgi:hypothetical protein
MGSSFVHCYQNDRRWWGCDGFLTTQQNVEAKAIPNTEHSELVTVIKQS